jgi:argininosuccinate lyase
MKFTDKQLQDLTEDQLDAIQASLESHVEEVSESPEEFQYKHEDVHELSKQLLGEMKRRYGS